MHASSAGLQLFGITLIGATGENGRKLLLTLAFMGAAALIAWVLHALLRLAIGSRAGTRFHFWARQVVSLSVALVVILALSSIWFDNPARLATFAGLLSAGLAFALQRVITAVAGYFVILRGRTFNVGDRIVMGGVRGDVIALSFMQTKIMEMGEPPREQPDAPAIWVKSRQFTGRIVTVTNDKIFDTPVYNYTEQFPYIWEELTLPVRYGDDRAKVEQIMVETGRRHALGMDSLAADEAEHLEKRYGINVGEIEPRVYWRLTDNWLELSLRFLLRDHGSRDVKDAMSRDLLAALDDAKIGIASATYEIVGVPPLEVRAGSREVR